MTPDDNTSDLRDANVAVVRQYLEAWTPFDLEAIGRVLHPSFELELGYAPEGVPERIQGKPAVMEFMATVPAVIAAMNFHQIAISTLHDAAELVAEYHGDTTALPTGRPYRNEYIARARVEDGLLRRYKEYSNPLVFLEAFVAGPAAPEPPS